jgi:hypothetical protein
MIIVHAKHVANNRTATLFSIVHQPNKPYPVKIQPKKEELPDFLKKSYGQGPLTSDRQSAMERLKLVPILFDNQWVSDTPSEFRENLSQVFNLGIIKREILNLASSAIDNKNDTSKDSDDDNLQSD